MSEQVDDEINRLLSNFSYWTRGAPAWVRREVAGAYDVEKEDQSIGSDAWRVIRRWIPDMFIDSSAVPGLGADIRKIVGGHHE